MPQWNQNHYFSSSLRSIGVALPCATTKAESEGESTCCPTDDCDGAEKRKSVKVVRMTLGSDQRDQQRKLEFREWTWNDWLWVMECQMLGSVDEEKFLSLAPVPNSRPHGRLLPNESKSIEPTEKLLDRIRATPRADIGPSICKLVGWCFSHRYRKLLLSEDRRNIATSAKDSWATVQNT